MSTLVKDASGNVVSTPAWDTAYGASSTGTAYVTAKSSHALIGPTTGVARLKRVTVTLATGGTAGDAIVQLAKCSAYTGFATVTATATPLNSTSGAATCVARALTNQTIGTIVGTAIRTARLCVASAAGATATQTVVWDFSRNMDQAPVLQGAASPVENFQIYSVAGTTAPASSVIDVDWEWEEASA